MRTRQTTWLELDGTSVKHEEDDALFTVTNENGDTTVWTEYEAEEVMRFIAAELGYALVQ